MRRCISRDIVILLECIFENVYEPIQYIKRGTYWIRRVLEKSYSLLFTRSSNSDFDLYNIYTIETIYNEKMTISLNNVHT